MTDIYDPLAVLAPLHKLADFWSERYNWEIKNNLLTSGAAKRHSFAEELRVAIKEAKGKLEEHDHETSEIFRRALTETKESAWREGCRWMRNKCAWRVAGYDLVKMTTGWRDAAMFIPGFESLLGLLEVAIDGLTIPSTPEPIVPGSIGDKP